MRILDLPHASRRTAAAAAIAGVALLGPVALAGPAAAASTPVVDAAATPRSFPPGAATLRLAARLVVDAGATGVIVRADDGRHPAVRVAAGAARLEPRRTLDPGDEFRVGSITKTFVATVALQLVGEGRLVLDEPVERRLPGAIPNGGKITVRMLLNQTSGLYNYTDDPQVEATLTGKVERSWTPRQLLAVATTHAPNFAPGTRFEYSNTNYVAAGLVLEQVTGRSMAELIEHRIARPLHLSHTYLPADARFRGPHAHGYDSPDGSFTTLLDASQLNPEWAWAAGALVSTADDLDRFYTALLAGRLLAPAQLAQMKHITPGSNGYGMGLFTIATPCGQVWGHNGGLPGYNSFALTDGRGRGSAVVLLPTGVSPKIDVAYQTATLAAICTMFGKPLHTT